MRHVKFGANVRWLLIYRKYTIHILWMKYNVFLWLHSTNCMPNMWLGIPSLYIYVFLTNSWPIFHLNHFAFFLVLFEDIWSWNIDSWYFSSEWYQWIRSFLGGKDTSATDNINRNWSVDIHYCIPWVSQFNLPAKFFLCRKNIICYFIFFLTAATVL